MQRLDKTTDMPIVGDKEPEFLLRFDFQPGLANPQRIFQAAAECIEVFQAWDCTLLKSFPSQIKPVFLLERVESGSLRIWLRHFLEAIDDEALKNIDWKPAIGKYLVKGKYLLMKKLGGRNGLPERAELTEISHEIHEIAKETDVLRLPAYAKISEADIANNAKALSGALSRLESGESVAFADDDGEATLSSDFKVTDEDIKNMLVQETITNESEFILKVRKPDFLGETKWEFRLRNRNMSVSIADKDWLARFQAGKIDIRPGDALHVKLRETISYDASGEAIEEEREIITVISVQRALEQASLL